MKRIALLTACTLAIATLTAIAATDWPEWRGPGRDGVAQDSVKLVDELPEQPKLVWEVQVLEHKPETHSSPIVADGRAYLHTSEEEQYTDEKGKKRKRSTEIVVCVSMDDGKELWRKTASGDVHNTPLVVDGKFYYADAERRANLHCLDAKTGAEQWKAPLGRGAGNGSPAAAGGVIAVPTGGELVGVDAAKGEVRWKVDVKAWNNSPVVWKHDGKEYLIYGNQELACIDPADGTKLWQIEGTKLQKDPASPVVHGDRMVTLFEGSGLKVYELTLKGPKEIASSDKFVAQTGGAHQAMTPAFDGKRVYGVDKEKTFCFDVAKGEIVWTAEKGDTHASPVLADGKLIVNHKRSLVLLDAETGKKLGEAKKVDSAGCSSCALVGGKLVVNEAKHLRCYDLSK